MVELDKELLRRLDTWVGQIAQALRPDAAVASTADGLRLGRKGSLSITATDGWYDHEAHKGGRDALSLIRHLRGCSAEAAVSWARGWLIQHLGDGDFAAGGTAEDAAEEAAERRAAWARRILEEAVDPLGTPAEMYLRSRRLEPPYPPGTCWLADARLGESAIVGKLTDATGEFLGVQLGYLDPSGRKSVVPPQRQMFLTDKEAARQGGFRIHVPGPVEGAAELVVVEGLEDALSVAQAGAAREVIGIPGVGRFWQFALPSAASVIVFRDGDAPDSEASKQLVGAIDWWLVAGVKVRIIDTPFGQDANSILQTGGFDEVRRLIAEAEPATFSFDADVRRLSELNKLEYERVRADSAKRHGVRVNFLDDTVRRAQVEAKARAEAEDDDPPYPEPVTDIAEVLDQALAEVRRYIVGDEPALAAVVVWSLHTHIVHHQHVRISVSPKLAIQSPEKGCGKTTLLEIIGTLVPRAETSSSITAATIFRLIEARRPTLLIDEADRVLRSSSEELIAVLNSSHRRSGAYVWRVEEVARQRVPTRFSTWGAVAFAGIRELPETLQDRSIAVRLPKALPGEVRAHLSDGTSSVLRTIKAKFARWTVDLRHLLEPKLPAGLHNRLGDNWRPLVALADLAGGRWPGLIRTAASSSLSADQEEGQLIALLGGIQRAFGEKDFLETQALIDSLLADDEYDWSTANNSRLINAAWLRWRLRGVLAPKADGTFGSDRRGSGKKERGYFRHRFEDAWSRYTPSSSDPQNTRSTRSTADNYKETNENNGPDTDQDTRSKSDDTRSTEDGNGAGPGNGTDGPGTGPGKEDLPGPEEHQQDEELTRNGPDRPGISGDADSESPPAEDSLPNVRRPGNGADSDWEPL